MIDPRAKLFHHLDRLAELQETGQTSAPINVEVDLSNRCSLGCSWCHFAYTHTRGPLAHVPGGDIPGGDLMDTALALRIVREFAGGNVRSITWTGGGEPTLHPRFDTIVAAAAEQISQGLYTNGCHIEVERAWRLKKQMEWVYISLDEITPDAYSKSKGVNARFFERALQGIRNLVAAKGKATVGMGVLLHEGNAECGPEAVRLARELGVDYVQFRPTILFDAARPGQRIEQPEWIGRALAAVPNDPIVSIDRARFEMYASWESHGYSRCHWSALQAVVTPNGSMWTCVNRREDRGSLIGSLAEEPFEKIWARVRRHEVDGRCRLMCRGHIPNLTVEELARPMKHWEFV